MGTHAAGRLLFRPAQGLGRVDLARLSSEIVSFMSKLVNGGIQGLARKVFGRGSDGRHARKGWDYVSDSRRYVKRRFSRKKL